MQAEWPGNSGEMDHEPTSDLSSAVVQTADGVVIRVHVQPKART